MTGLAPAPDVEVLGVLLLQYPLADLVRTFLHSIAGL